MNFTKVLRLSRRPPTAEFSRTVLRLRSTWLRTCRDIQGTAGQRHLARQVVGRGRLGAITPIDPITVPGLPSHLPLGSISIADLQDDQRREVIEAGQVAKQLTFSGVMFIDGDHVLPRTWNRMADELLGPEPPARRGARSRPATRSTLKAPHS